MSAPGGAYFYPFPISYTAPLPFFPHKEASSEIISLPTETFIKTLTHDLSTPRFVVGWTDGIHFQSDWSRFSALISHPPPPPFFPALGQRDSIYRPMYMYGNLLVLCLPFAVDWACKYSCTQYKSINFNQNNPVWSGNW